MRTKRLPCKYKGMVEGKYPNAGPYPCIAGMKKQYWDTCGRESITVMCGTYPYLLGYEMTGEIQHIYEVCAR